MNKYYFGITDTGKVRDNNEDALLVEPMSNDRVLAAVIDGVGGYEGGEVAAEIAKACIAEIPSKPMTDVRAALSETVIEINRRIFEARRMRSGRESMACVLTLVVADFATNEFHYAHVGDTRLYLLRGASLVKVSKDHSFVGFLEESNRLTEQDAMRHPKRNEVNKALGLDEDISSVADYIDKGSSPFLPGDTLLLCSDGLTDMVDSQQIIKLMTADASIPSKAMSLVDAANDAGGKDNVTVVVVHNRNSPATHEPTMPLAKEPQPVIPVPVESSPVPVKRSNPLVLILSLLCLGLIGVVVWLYSQQPRASEKEYIVTTGQTISRQRNPGEQQFVEAIGSAADSLVIDSARFQSPIMVSDSVAIDKDSFRIVGNGLVLRGDSSLKSPAIVFGSSARYVILEDLVFENFDVALQSYHGVLRLRNVRFINCRTSIAYAYQFSEAQPVSGVFPANNSFILDSFAVKN